MSKEFDVVRDAPETPEQAMAVIESWAGNLAITFSRGRCGRCGLVLAALKKIEKEHCDCENKSQCWEPCGELGHSTEHVKVHQQEPATEVVTTELAMFKRMFHAACEALGEINEALGLDPDDGGAEPILDAIAKLQAAQAQGEPKKDLMFSTVAMQERHDERIERTVATLEHVKQEHGNAEDMYVEMHKHLNCPHCGGSGHIEDVKQEQCEPVAQHRDLHSHMMVVAHRAADKVTNNGQKFVSQKEVVRAICKAIQDDKNLISKLTPPAKQEQGETLTTNKADGHFEQPNYGHVGQAFIDGAREARVNPRATDDDFNRAADGYTKRLFEELDPESERLLREQAHQEPKQKQKQKQGQPNYKELWQQMCERCDCLDKKLAIYSEQEPIGEAYLCNSCQTPFDGAYECPSCGHHTSTKTPVYIQPSDMS